MRINYYELIEAIKANTLREIRAGASKEDIEKRKQKLLKQWKHPMVQRFVESIDYDRIKEHYKIDK